MTLSFTLHHSNKENEHSSLNGTAPPRCRRSTAVNPCETSKKVPTPFALNEAKIMNSCPLATVKPACTAMTSVNASSLSTNTSQINKDSPAIQRILKATGCSSVEELLARDQQKTQANHASNGPKAATNQATNRAKTAPNGPKAANGTKSSNPKKKVKSKYFIRHFWLLYNIMISLTQLFNYITYWNESKSTNRAAATKTNRNTNGSKAAPKWSKVPKSANGSKVSSTNPKKKAKSKYCTWISH